MMSNDKGIGGMVSSAEGTVRYEDVKAELLQDSGVRAAYEDLEPMADTEPKFNELKPHKLKSLRRRWHWGHKGRAGRWGWFGIEWDLWEWAFGVKIGLEPPCEDPSGLFEQDGWGLSFGLFLGPVDFDVCFERREVDE